MASNRDLVLRIALLDDYGFVTEYVDLDIDKNIPIRLDISTIENDKIGRLFGIGSQTFDLPGTKTNNRFFKNAFSISSTESPGLYEFVKCYLLLDGEIILAGKMQLMEIITSDDGYVDYKVQIIDQTVDFKTQIEGTKIADADWSAYDHTLNIAAITSSWSNQLLNGSVFYPLMDLGNDGRIQYPTLPRVMVKGYSGSVAPFGSIDQAASPMGYQQFQPAIKAIDVFNVMFNQAGFSYTSSLVTSSSVVFNNLFTLPKANDKLGVVLTSPNEGTVVATLATSQSVASVAGGGYFEDNYDFTVETSDPSNRWTIVGGVPRYTSNTYGSFTFALQGEITDIAPSSGPGAVAANFLKVYNSSGTLINIATCGSTGISSTSIGTTFFVNGTRTLTLSTGDYVIPYYSITNYSSGATATGNWIIGNPNRSYFQCAVAPVIWNNSNVSMAKQWASDTKTVDVLRGFCEQFNLIISPEPAQDNVLRVETFDTWMLQGRKKDWTQKYETAKRISIKHPISEQNKTIFIGGREDNDRFSVIAKEGAPNLQYGTRQLIAQSNIPQGERKITTFFAPVILGSMILSGSLTAEGAPTFNLSGTDMVVPHLYKRNNNTQDTFGFKPRLGYKIDDFSTSICDGGTIKIGENGTVFAVTDYSTLCNISSLDTEAGRIYNLHFDKDYPDYVPVGGLYANAQDASVDSYTAFWSNYIEGLYWSEARKVTLDLYFTPEEYKDIRLNDTIQIKDQTYRINKISGFNLTAPDVVKVDLIKEYPVYFNVTDVTGSAPPPPPLPVENLRYMLNLCDTEELYRSQELASGSFNIGDRVRDVSSTEYFAIEGVYSTGSFTTKTIYYTGEVGCEVVPCYAYFAGSYDRVYIDYINCDGHPETLYIDGPSTGGFEGASFCAREILSDGGASIRYDGDCS
jgi:hypothetical protein